MEAHSHYPILPHKSKDQWRITPRVSPRSRTIHHSLGIEQWAKVRKAHRVGTAPRFRSISGWALSTLHNCHNCCESPSPPKSALRRLEIGGSYPFYLAVVWGPSGSLKTRHHFNPKLWCLPSGPIPKCCEQWSKSAFTKDDLRHGENLKNPNFVQECSIWFNSNWTTAVCCTLNQNLFNSPRSGCRICVSQVCQCVILFLN